jgi:hypothetical protein
MAIATLDQEWTTRIYITLCEKNATTLLNNLQRVSIYFRLSFIHLHQLD